VLGFGGSVASLKATLTLDDDGFVRGMADASTKLDAYNAKLKEQGVGSRLATMASREYAKQLYNEAKSVDQANAAHGRLFRTMQFGQQHWKALGTGAVGAGVGILALTGHVGALTGVLGQLGTAALPVANAGLTGLLSPLTSLAAIIVGLAGPLSALVTLFGAVGAGAGFGLYSALTSNNKAFNDLQNRVGNMGHMFHDLGDALGQRFLPYLNEGVTWIEKFIKYGDQLAHMSLPGVIQSISTKGVAMLQHLNRDIYNLIGRPLLQIFSASFGKAGNRISDAFSHMLSIWSPLVGKMWGIFTRWFDRQHFEQTGATWAAAIVNTAVPVIASALWSAVRSEFSSLSAWGKIGMIAGAAFAANFFSGGLLSKGIFAGGKGLLGLLGRGAAAGGGVAAGEGVAGGGAASGGGGIVSALGGAAGVAAIVGIAVPAALVYLSSRQSSSSQNKFGSGPGITPRGPGSPGFLPPDIRKEAAADAAALDRVAAAEKNLNQYIADGGKSVLGWRIAWGKATNQARDAQAATHDLAQKGVISADQAAQQSKGNLQNFINQETQIAAKATTAAGNTAKFGASTRAQYAHVAALARTSAQLAAAINSIPSQKYVSLVVSITENLRSQGNAPGQGRGIGAAGGVVTGGVPNQDSVKALLMPGEVVLSKSAVSMLGGPAAANSLNPNGGYIHMANGGAVLNYSGGVPPSKVASSWGFKVPKSLDEHENAAVKKALEERHKALQKAKTPKERAAAWVAYNHAVDHAKAARRGGVKAAGESYYNRVQTNIGNWIGLEQSSQDPNMDATLGAMYKRELSFIQGGLAWARKHHFNEGQWVWDARNLENTIAGQQQQQAAASAQEIATFLSTQQGFLGEFASNIILPGAQAVLSGGVSGGTSASSTAGGRLPFRSTQPGSGVTIHNHFTQSPPDAFVHIRKAKLQAEAVWS